MPQAMSSNANPSALNPTVAGDHLFFRLGAFVFVALGCPAAVQPSKRCVRGEGGVLHTIMESRSGSSA